MDALDMKSREIFFSEIDSFLDFNYSNSFQNNSAKNDIVIPIQSKFGPMMNHHAKCSCLDIEFCISKLSSFNYASQSISQSIYRIHSAGTVPIRAEWDR
ncbi:hypothetical protein HN51_038126 [Arachis hypogaea]